jgi:hypothetical protein
MEEGSHGQGAGIGRLRIRRLSCREVLPGVRTRGGRGHHRLHQLVATLVLDTVNEPGRLEHRLEDETYRLLENTDLLSNALRQAQELVKFVQV